MAEVVRHLRSLGLSAIENRAERQDVDPLPRTGDTPSVRALVTRGPLTRLEGVLPAAVRPCGSAAELIGRRSSSGSVALGSRAGRESSDGAVDQGAAGFATLQADVVAAMAKAGQRGSRGMRQPSSGGDQLFQPGALIALEQFDHACDLRALAGRRRCWRGRCAPGRRHICCGLRFRRIIVRVRRNGRAGYGLRAALIGRDGLQSRVSQFQRIRLACFLVASPGFHSGLRFDLARQAGLQKLGRDLLRRGEKMYQRAMGVIFEMISFKSLCWASMSAV